MIREQILEGRNLLRTILHTPPERVPLRKPAQDWDYWSDIVEAEPDYVLTADLKGHVRYCNPAARRTLGIGAGEDVSRVQLTDVYPSWARARVLGEGILTALLDGVWNGETALLTRAAREVPVSQVILAPLAPESRCDLLTIIARDITETKRAAETLRQSERFYRRIIETANIGIWIEDTESKASFVNGRMANRLGYHADEIVGKPMASFMEAGESASAEAQPLAYGRAGEESRAFRFRCKDGAELRMRVCASPLFDEQEQHTGTLVIIPDLR